MNFDPGTAIISLVVAPVLYFALRRLGKFLKQNTQIALEALFFHLGKSFRSSLAMRVSLRKYCRAGLSDPRYRYLIVPGRDQVSLEADKAFVSLKLQNAAEEHVYSDDVRKMQNIPRVRVIGDPGSGKSSLAKKMFRDACRDAAKFKSGHRLPILVELKRFSPPKSASTERSRVNWAIKYFEERVSAVHGFDMPQLFDSYLTGKGIFLILDGLDEVASSDYLRVAEMLRALSRALAVKSPNNSIILTMRSQFHTQVSDHLESEFPLVFHVQPFTPEDIYTFLSRWPHYVGEKRLEILRVYNDLTDRPTLREMCSNPLVLGMYVSHDQHGGNDVAIDTRTSFYSKVVEELLVARRSRQLEIPARSLLREQRESIFGPLAFEHLLDSTQAANSLDWTRAVELVSEVYGCDSGEAERRFRELAKETGLISEERTGETYRFIHLTFCEFFAAKEAAEGREEGWQELISVHNSFSRNADSYAIARLGEVIPFALALLTRARRPDAIKEIAAISENLIIGRCFLETQLYDQEVWDRYTRAESEFLRRTPSNKWDDEWLRRLHLFNVVLKDEEEWATSYGRQKGNTLEVLFKDLVGDDRQRLIQLFSSYAAVDASAAMRLARSTGLDLVTEQPQIVLNNMPYPPFRAHILEELKADSSPSDEIFLILAEASLQNKSVALDCDREESIDFLKERVSLLERRLRWFRSDSVFWRAFYPSLYLHCLSYSVALVNRGGDFSKFPTVVTVSEVPAPGSVSLRFQYIWFSIPVIPPLAAALLIGNWRFSDFLNGWASQIPFLLLGQLFATSLMGIGQIPMTRRALYVDLVNLTQIPFRVTSVQRIVLPRALLRRLLPSRLLRACLSLRRPLVEDLFRSEMPQKQPAAKVDRR
ncbi:NACHT domain-containing protein [Streptomyces sp. NPDC050548]|uniref:NACHT domain-containing protein n=1 Tax=Streptomyces sp. NPDC050548 TaxID=3365629 RepID=UPI0037BAAD3F